MALDKSRINVEVAVSLVNKGKSGKGKRFELSKGTVHLLKEVEKVGSLMKASKNLGMAFSNSWHKVSTIEEGFKVNLLQSHGRKGSSLTEDAKQLVAIYDAALVKAEKSIK